VNTRRVPAIKSAWRYAIVTMFLLLALATTVRLRSFLQAGITYMPPDLPVHHVPFNRMGVNTKLQLDVTDDQLRRDFTAVRDGGFGWVRQEFQWDQIEPDVRGVFWDAKYNQSSWTKWDRIVDLAQEYGIELIVRIDRPPAWSHPRLLPLLAQHPAWEGPPEHIDDFGNIVAAIAGRYRGKVTYIQLWNEPNLENEWAGSPVRPADYAAMLRVGAERVRAANPDAVVLAAALAPTIEPGPAGGYANMSDLLYIQGLYDAGAAPYFDVVTLNPYGLKYSPYVDHSVGLRSNQFPRAVFRPPDRFDFSRPLAVRAIMERNGDTRKPIWAAEFGWNTVPSTWTGEKSPWEHVTPSQQARFLQQAYQRARDEWPWMGVMNVWYLREPVDVNPRDPTPYFALLHQDWSPTPGYLALQRMSREQHDASTGSSPPSTPAARYGFAGAWRPEHSNDGTWTYTVAAAPEAYLSFDFSGSNIAIVARTTANSGQPYVRIDQSPNLANLLPTDKDGNAYIDLYSPTLAEGVRIPLARDLPPGPHRLDLVIKGAKNAASVGTDTNIGAFVVGQTPWAGWSYLLGLLGGAVTACLALPVVRMARRTWTRMVEPRIPSRLLVPFLVGDTSGTELKMGHAIASTHAQGPVNSKGGDARAPSHPVPDALFFMALLASAALYYLSPRLSLAAVGLIIFSLLALVRLDLGLLIAIPAAPLVFLPRHIASFQFSPLETVIAVCVVAWILRTFWIGQVEVHGNRLTVIALALVVIGLVSLSASVYLRVSLREFRLVIIEPVLWFLMLETVVPRRRMWWMARLLVATGCVVAMLGLVGLLLGRSVIATEGVRRVASIYPSPDNLGLFLDRVVPVAACLFIFGQRHRVWYGASMVLVCAVLVLTFSRGAWIGVVVAGLVICLCNWRVFNWQILTIGGVLITVALIVGNTLHVARLSFTGVTTTARLLLWHAAVRMIRDHPLRGIGMDQFLYLYPRYRLAEAWREPYLSHPHNVVLDFWLQLGLPGLIWFCGVTTVIVARLKDVVVHTRSNERALALGVLGAMVAGGVHGLLDNSFFVPDLAVLFWSLVAILVRIGSPDEAPNDVLPRLPNHGR